jgi:catechol 2,3-dioxygenase-like lactoylglutathione lyase family enzyme
VFLTFLGDRADLLTLNPAPELQHLVGQSGGVEHFGIAVSDMVYDSWAASIEAHGGSVVERGTFPTGAPSFYVADPDGYKIEIHGLDLRTRAKCFTSSLADT